MEEGPGHSASQVKRGVGAKVGTHAVFDRSVDHRDQDLWWGTPIFFLQHPLTLSNFGGNHILGSSIKRGLGVHYEG